MDTVIGVLNALAPVVMVLVSTGLIVKYVPIKILAAIPNVIIPFLNAVLAFFTAFGPAPAEAGIFGAVGVKFGFAAKLVASAAISAAASVIYETYLRGPLDRLGLKKATP